MKKSALTLAILFLGLFTAVNIIAASQFPPLFYDLAGPPIREDVVITFLNHLKGTSFFKGQYSYFLKLSTNNSLKERLFASEKRRKQTIDKFESILEKNSAATDVLLILAALYKREGNLDKSQQYLTRARQIDPTVSPTTEDADY